MYVVRDRDKPKRGGTEKEEEKNTQIDSETTTQTSRGKFRDTKRD